jgi:hypothetical protein
MSGALNVLSIGMHPAFICGCDFHSSALPVEAMPLAFGAFMLARYRFLGERLVAYANGAFALWWLYYIWVSNLQFACY